MNVADCSTMFSPMCVLCMLLPSNTLKSSTVAGKADTSSLRHQDSLASLESAFAAEEAAQQLKTQPPNTGRTTRTIASIKTATTTATAFDQLDWFDQLAVAADASDESEQEGEQLDWFEQLAVAAGASDESEHGDEPTSSLEVAASSPAPAIPAGAGATSGLYQHHVVDKKQHVTDALYRRLQAVTEVVGPSSRTTLKAPLNAFVWHDVFTKGECITLGEGLRELGLQYEFWNPLEPDKTALRFCF